MQRLFMNNKRNNTAIYCRLSNDDGTDTISQSISNQREILTRYVIEHGWLIYDIYVDDGYSGTNFDRPGFKKMIEDIEKGNIDIVITKDLSRLGRDYLETGRFTEQYFPDHNIRYIALNDNVDTGLKELDDFVPFKNIINEWYAKDISKKIRITQKKQMESGEFKRTGVPLYGYMYDSESKRIPYPDTKDNVVKIFDMFCQGYSLKGIAEKLINSKVLSPLAYYQTINPNSKKKVENPYNWKSSTIEGILKNREYLGHYIRGKVTSRFKSKVKRFVPPKEQYVFENVFEPLISKETFEFAQTMFTHSMKNTSLINPFFKIAYCGVCGKPLYYMKHKSSKGYEEERLYCKSNGEPNKGSIKLDDLKEVIKNELLSLSEIIKLNFQEFEIRSKESINKELAPKKNFDEIRITKAEDRIKEIDDLIQKLFEKNADAPMPLDIYKKLMQEYTKERSLLVSDIERFKLAAEDNNKDIDITKNYNNFIKAIKQLNDNKPISLFIIKNLISKISITTKPEENTSSKTKIITITYKACDEFIKDFIKEKKGE